MKKNQVELSGLKLKLNGREVELTIAEAKDLSEQLNLLFGHAHQYVPTCPPYQNPIVIDRGPWWPIQWETWCGPNPTCGIGPGTMMMSVGKIS